MNGASWVALVMLVVAAGLTVWRAVRPGTLGDRAVALDMIAAVIQCGLMVATVLTGDGILVDVALALGLLGFLSSVTVSRFIERRDGAADGPLPDAPEGAR